MEALLAACAAKYVYCYKNELEPILEHYGSLHRCYKAVSKDKTPTNDSLLEKLKRAWSKDRLKEMEELLDDYSLALILVTHPVYPILLKEIDDAPYLLFARGNVDILTNSLVSIVGTRKASVYGRRSVEYLVGGIKGYGVTTVSGLALGIDAAVHAASLDHDIPTIAVLGGGLDRYEPTSNARLAQRIIETGGLLLSEYPPGVRPEKYHFLARNRIIAGLSELTIVVEGEHKSGSLVTARMALRYGRDVGAVPGDIFSPLTDGPHALIADGAWPIDSGQIILDLLGKESKRSGVRQSLPLPFDTLLRVPQSIDAICHQTGLGFEEAMTQIAEWEIAGFVKRLDTGEYVKD